MSFFLPALLFVIIFAAIALLFNNGVWSNAVRLINAVTAAMLATNYFEPLAKALEGMAPGLTYLWDFVSLWLLFIILMIVFQTLTATVSKVNVKFVDTAEKVGSPLLAFLVGWVLVSFTLTTLHTAPLGRNFLFGGFKPGESMFLGMSPDLQWLGFMQRQSKGSFSRSVGPEEQSQYGSEGVAAFDPRGKFVANYAERRTAVEKSLGSGGSVFSGEGAVAR